MSLPRKRESTIADFLDSRFRGNDETRCPLGGRHFPADTKNRFWKSMKSIDIPGKILMGRKQVERIKGGKYHEGGLS